MSKSYYYDHDSDTTKITSVEKVNGELVTTTKTVEGNQIPQKDFMPTDLKSWAILGFVGLTGLNILWAISPALIVTPIAAVGAFKLTEKKKTNEKVIATVGVGVLSVILCEMLFKPPVPTYSSRSSAPKTITTDYGQEVTRKQLQNARIECKKIAKARGTDPEPCWKYSDQF